MVKSNKRYITTAVLFCLATITTNVFAIECFSESPNLIQQKDKYFDTGDFITLSDQEINKLNTLFANVDGDWLGELMVEDCTGSERDPRIKTMNGSIAAQITSGADASLTIRAEMKEAGVRGVKYKTLKILENRLVSSYEFANKTNFIYSEKYRRRNVNNSHRLVESISDITLVGNSFTLVLSSYVNGALVAEETWTLTTK